MALTCWKPSPASSLKTSKWYVLVYPAGSLKKTRLWGRPWVVKFEKGGWSIALPSILDLLNGDGLISYVFHSFPRWSNIWGIVYGPAYFLILFGTILNIFWGIARSCYTLKMERLWPCDWILAQHRKSVCGKRHSINCDPGSRFI